LQPSADDGSVVGVATERPQTERVESLETRVAMLAWLPDRISRLEAEVSAFRWELREGFEVLREGLRAEIRAGDEETRHLIEESTAETRRLIDESTAETRRLIEETRQLIQESEDETRRFMRVLHEDVVSRLQSTGEALGGGPGAGTG
jgi:hypothetical protein